MEIWKSQNRGFPHSHRLGGYDEQTGKNPKNRTQSVKHVPGLKCKTCPRLDTSLVRHECLLRAVQAFSLEITIG